MSDDARIPEVGDRLRSRDARQGVREVRVIERGLCQIRVENVVTERRTFLRIPLAREWRIVVETPPYGQAPDA